MDDVSPLVVTEYDLRATEYRSLRHETNEYIHTIWRNTYIDANSVVIGCAASDKVAIVMTVFSVSKANTRQLMFLSDLPGNISVRFRVIPSALWFLVTVHALITQA